MRTLLAIAFVGALGACATLDGSPAHYDHLGVDMDQPDGRASTKAPSSEARGPVVGYLQTRAGRIALTAARVSADKGVDLTKMRASVLADPVLRVMADVDPSLADLPARSR